MIPYSLLIACEYDKININTKIFNKDALSSGVWVNLPPYVSALALKSIIDVSKQKYEEVEFSADTVMQDYPHPWVRIDSGILDLVSGMHIYKLVFAPIPENGYSESVYIAYIIQDDNPETPYVYMPDRGNPPKTEEDEG